MDDFMSKERRSWRAYQTMTCSGLAHAGTPGAARADHPALAETGSSDKVVHVPCIAQESPCVLSVPSQGHTVHTPYSAQQQVTRIIRLVSPDSQRDI